MAFPVASRKAAFISTPRAYETSGPAGQVVAITVSTAADYINLSLGVTQAVFDRTTCADPKSPTRNYLTVECDVDLGIIFGSTVDLVTDSNVPAIATVGTLSGGVYTGAAKTCFVLYAKQPARFLLQEGADLFMGFVASAGGTMRLYQSSPDNA